jgi:hypothetical protein
MFRKLLAGILILLSLTANGQMEPYLQAVTPNSIWVSWKTGTAGAPKVEYGLSPGALNQQAAGSTQTFTDSGYPGNYFYHGVQLKNLQPNTKYYYKASLGAQSSDVYSFRTLPAPGQAATPGGHTRFLIMGDNQIKAQPRFDSLVVYAKRKCTELYGPGFNDSVSMILMVGDQVDVGTLDHYENVHFAKCRYLSPLLPISTIIGNHETYGTLQLGAYYDHFFYDSLQYGGIYSGTETYYAFQAGRVLIVNLSTEHTSGAVGAAQHNWLQQVVSYANSDPTVDWILSFGHRPYQAEQYVGDISPWIRNTAVPLLATSPKFFLHTGAHHHLYARGQLKDTPNYHIISGGTAWDQYWGMSTEIDFDDVQKTLPNWPYQIVDFDLENKRVDVQTFSVGSIYEWHDNRLIDEFHRVKDQAGPTQPAITTTLPDTLELPFTIASSPFQSPAGELMNSTQFQFSLMPGFATLELDKLRDYENYFGSAGAPDTTTDIHLGVNILEYTIPQGGLSNGLHYVRVRHRDRNLEWSPWSEAQSFTVINSVQSEPKLMLSQHAYAAGDTIVAVYENGPGGAQDWIGIYKKGETPGQVNSTTWSYVSGGSGVLKFTLTQKGEYFAAFFKDGGYEEIAPRVPFYYGPIPEIASDKGKYDLGEQVKISFSFAPALEKDWIGIYKIGMEPGGPASIQWQYTGSVAAGQLAFNNLPKGYYFANYFLNDGYFEPAERIFFAVGDTIANLVIDKSLYNLGEYIIATWTDGPGIPKDWLGIYQSWKDPNADPLDAYTYIGGQPAGSLTLADTLVPQEAGSYYLVLFTNDSYNEISNRCYFSITDGNTGTNNLAGNDGIKLYPNPGGEYTIVESPYPIEKVEVLSPDGRLIYRSDNNANSLKFSLLNQQLPPGAYVVKVYSRKVHSLQLIIQ